MVAKIQDIEFPEIFIGFVAPIGIDVRVCVKDFRESFEYFGYRVVEIRVTNVFAAISKYIKPESKLTETPLSSRYDSYIKYGNQLRREMDDDALLAALSVGRVAKIRSSLTQKKNDRIFERTCYLIHQFKRKEEIDLLRSVYGTMFFQVSIYSRRGTRVDYLAHRFANDQHSGNVNEYRAEAEKFVQRDENEREVAHGQRVSKVFAEGDLIINVDILRPGRTDQIHRFVRLLFGSNALSPTKSEYGMFVAKAAALRTLDLSRQVGAAIFSKSAEVIAMGSNEVPKGLGGTYWSDDEFDDREFCRLLDTNDRRKEEVLQEIVDRIGRENVSDSALTALRETQLMDSLEYGRVVHAEMSALTDAARKGREVNNSILYCTTFPCHMCAKHIVAAGIAKVVFLEPYPKSLVLDLHSDSISIEQGDRGRYQAYPAVEFEHFSGISPRRYRELFERGKRKNDDGSFRAYVHGQPQPHLSVSWPFYARMEDEILNRFVRDYRKRAKMDETILNGAPDQR